MTKYLSLYKLAKLRIIKKFSEKILKIVDKKTQYQYNNNKQLINFLIISNKKEVNAYERQKGISDIWRFF